jgi:hypothetical protein
MYQLPGFYQLPMGSVLIQKCVNIINLGGPATWGKVVTEALRGEDNLGRDTVRVNELTEDVLYAMKGAGPFINSSGNSGFTDLLYVVQYCLNSMGAPVDVPAIVGYRETPEIDFETSIDYAFGDAVAKPQLGDLGAGDRATTFHFRGWFVDFVRQTALLSLERANFTARIRAYMGHAAWKGALKQPLSPHEKTMLIRFGDPLSYPGLTNEEKASATKARAPVTIAETANPLVLRDWARYEQANLCGPVTKFGKGVSNALIEQLCYSWGPAIGPFKFPIGTIVPFGPWSELRMTESFTLDQTVKDFLTASREKSASVLFPRKRVAASGFDIQPPQRVARGRLASYIMNWDMEPVKLRFNPDASTTKPEEYYWDSQVRQRMLSSKFRMVPEDVVAETALAHAEFGDGLHGPTSLSDWPFLDLESSKPFLGAKTPKQLALKERIYYIKDRKLVDKEVDMEVFYTTYGKQYTVPAFCDAVDIPLHWLAAEQPLAEDFIVGQLDLNREQREHAISGVRRSHNYASLARLFDASQLPFDDVRLKRLISALSGL